MSRVHGLDTPEEDTMAGRGRRKGRRCIIAIVRGSMDNEGDARKFNDMCVIVETVRGCVPGTRVSPMDGEVLVVDMPEHEGDPELAQTVLNRVDIQKCVSPQDAPRVADAVMSRMAELNVPPEAFGTGVIIRYINKMYMHHTVWSEDDDQA